MSLDPKVLAARWLHLRVGAGRNWRSRGMPGPGDLGMAELDRRHREQDRYEREQEMEGDYAEPVYELVKGLMERLAKSARNMGWDFHVEEAPKSARDIDVEIEEDADPDGVYRWPTASSGFDVFFTGKEGQDVKVGDQWFTLTDDAEIGLSAYFQFDESNIKEAQFWVAGHKWKARNKYDLSDVNEIGMDMLRALFKHGEGDLLKYKQIAPGSGRRRKASQVPLDAYRGSLTLRVPGT